jgi:hypothetical protein
MWPHGNEPAFTLIPNFLVTGIAAMIVGLIVIVWSLFFVQKQRGPTCPGRKLYPIPGYVVLPILW